jgi:MinD-like ATPase involved in chromosome partitioning or flagellar assembly
VRSDIAAHIPSSRAVPISVNKGVPITLDSPGHPVSQALTKFAQQHLVVAKAPAGGRLESRSRGRRRVA